MSIFTNGFSQLVSYVRQLAWTGQREAERRHKEILMKISELKGRIDRVSETTDKILKEVTTLKDSLKDADIPQDAQASLDRLEGLVKQVDDQIPDSAELPTDPAAGGANRNPANPA